MLARMSAGFHLYHGNRLEVLAEALATVLGNDPAPPLAGEVVMVPHPGMAQWLKMRLADHLGIAAQFEFPLPATWFGRLAGVGQAPEDSLAWSGDALVWRLYALDAASGPLAAVGTGDERAALARWQLAGRIAELFERYQLQRADWLDAWQHDRIAVPGADAERWQRVLWRQLLVEATPQRRQALDRRLHPQQLVEGLPPRLFVFGVASLPRLFLDGLWALSERLPVHLFFANPCQWYWGDLLSERERLRRRGNLAIKSELGPDQEGHPLLAGFGAVARDFLHQLYDGDAAFANEIELFHPASGASVLAQIQNAMLALESPPLNWVDDDRSLRLLRAPSRRRELEALHDLLLDLFQRDPQLRPNEIAVLVPKLADYAPLADAIFGGQPSQRRIPYQITDLSEAERHPLPALLLRLLDLPVWRFGLGEVLDALARPAFAAAFAITGDELPRLGELLEHAGARWGLDGAFRERFGAGHESEHSFRFAVDRLLAGWLSGDQGGFADGIAPFTALRGQDAELLGRFVVCLDALDRWRQRLAGERSLTEWSRLLAELRAQFFADSADADENAALLRLTGSLQAWRERSAAYGETVVPRRLLREALSESLHSHAVSALPGEGVNLCAMVPLRGLPFRVVVLLGLGEGEFPRRERELPDDLCRLRPRAGDRSRVAEDRYLFLEALASARSTLVLSHVDRDPESGQARPPSPVLAELLDYLRDAAFAGVEPALDARIERVAPLSGDPRHYLDAGREAGYVPSYAAEWLTPPPPLPPVRALADHLPSDWRELYTLLVDPVRCQLRWRGVELGGDGEPVEDSEPLRLDGLGNYLLRDTLLSLLAAEPELEAEHALGHCRALALLPPGHSGARAFAGAWAEASQIHALYRTHAEGRDLGRFEGRIAHAGLDWPLRLDDVDGQGLLRRSAGDINGRRQLAAWLDLLALRLARGGAGLCATLIGRDGRIVLHAPEDAGAALERLLALWRQARVAPLPWFPRTSFAYAQALAASGEHEHALIKAQTVWYGDEQGRREGEGNDPACAELARAAGGWQAPPFAAVAEAVYGPVLAAVPVPP